MRTITIYDGPATPTDDDNDRVIVDYKDNTQKEFVASTDRSGEATKVKAILDAFFA